MLILLSTLLLLLLYLAAERTVLSRTRRAIPMVIAVTGTRGKSTVARSLGSVLRASGRRVLVKTTGTEAQYILPDGTVAEVPRRTPPTILEQKAVLRRAARCGAEVLVAEVMSIEPGNHIVESQQILQPDVVIITNVRLDHTEAMGETLEEIAETLSHVVVPGCRVFAPQDQIPLFHASQEADWHTVPSWTGPEPGASTTYGWRFGANERLVAAVAGSLGVSDEVIGHGLRTSRPDRGGFAMWSYGKGGKTVFLVNAFAANDPESTSLLLERSKEGLEAGSKLYGMFAIRSDRGERTLQWVEALRHEPWTAFEEVFLVGDVSPAVARKIRRSTMVTGTDPALVTEEALRRMESGSMLLGFGNTHGIGLELVDHWMKEGTTYGT